MQQVREQLAASFTALGQARPQTVAELVDSVRQQIAGGSSTPGMEGNIAGEELQVLELLGEGTVSWGGRRDGTAPEDRAP